jgi:hypothetical protein
MMRGPDWLKEHQIDAQATEEEEAEAKEEEEPNEKQLEKAWAILQTNNEPSQTIKPDKSNGSQMTVAKLLLRQDDIAIEPPKVDVKVLFRTWEWLK